MSYCPNCGGQVKDEHFYCGQCGYRLADGTEEDDQRAPSGTAAGHSGFLSGRSNQYLNAVLNGERELDPDKVAYSNLSRDVKGALVDFAKLGIISELDLLNLVADQRTDAEVMVKNTDDLNRWETEERLMWMGLFRIPRIYDRTLGTEWENEFVESVGVLSEKAEELENESDED